MFYLCLILYDVSKYKACEGASGWPGGKMEASMLWRVLYAGLECLHPGDAFIYH